MIDRTTRWPESVPLNDMKADTVTEAFMDGWVMRFWIPEVVTSDWGAQFTSERWQQSLAPLGITASTTAAYHPQANGLVEQFNHTLKNALCCAVSGSSWAGVCLGSCWGCTMHPKMTQYTLTAEVCHTFPGCASWNRICNCQLHNSYKGRGKMCARSHDDSQDEQEKISGITFHLKRSKESCLRICQEWQPGKAATSSVPLGTLQGSRQELEERNVPDSTTKGWKFGIAFTIEVHCWRSYPSWVSHRIPQCVY